MGEETFLAGRLRSQMGEGIFVLKCESRAKVNAITSSSSYCQRNFFAYNGKSTTYDFIQVRKLYERKMRTLYNRAT